MSRHARPSAGGALIAFTRQHPARVYSVAASALALIAVYVPGLPSDSILALVAALLWGGSAVQRCENRKTQEAADKSI